MVGPHLEGPYTAWGIVNSLLIVHILFSSLYILKTNLPARLLYSLTYVLSYLILNQFNVVILILDVLRTHLQAHIDLGVLKGTHLLGYNAV
jgi:hypothetical protein